MKQMTIKAKLEMVKDYVQGKEVEMAVEDMVTFIDERIAQLEKKSATKRVKTEKPEEAKLREAIVEIMGDKTVSVKEIREAYDGEINSQKVVGKLTQLIEAGRVEKVVEGKDTKYHVVG